MKERENIKNKKRVKNKRGVSDVVANTFIILLTIIAVSILSIFVVNFVRDKLESSGSCLDALNQIKLNPEYTCYFQIPQYKTSGPLINQPNPDITGVLVNVETGDIKVDKLSIVLSGAGESKSAEIVDGESMINCFIAGSSSIQDADCKTISMYGASSGVTTLTLPKENEGKTYSMVFDWTNPECADPSIPPCYDSHKYKYYMKNIENIKIVPTIKGKQCDITSGQVVEQSIEQCTQLVYDGLSSSTTSTTDTDGGKNYYVKGTCTDYPNAVKIEHTDVCDEITKPWLWEQYIMADGISCYYELYKCEMVGATCNNGACV